MRRDVDIPQADNFECHIHRLIKSIIENSPPPGRTPMDSSRSVRVDHTWWGRETDATTRAADQNCFDCCLFQLNSSVAVTFGNSHWGRRRSIPHLFPGLLVHHHQQLLIGQLNCPRELPSISQRFPSSSLLPHSEEFPRRIKRDSHRPAE